MTRPVSGGSVAGLVTLAEIEAAGERISGRVRRTPLLPTGLGPPERPLLLKAECLQETGSFKARGAANAIALLTPAERERGVVTHSSGNHGRAVAWAARAAGLAATVVMPKETPAVKRAAVEALGAEVVYVDAAERADEVERLRSRTGATPVPPYDHPAVIAGQGTVGLEIVEDLPEIGCVFVPVSGGGLVSGIATAVKALRPVARVIGVEPALAGDLAEGFARREHVAWTVSQTSRTIADGLRVPTVGDLPWAHIRAYVDDVVTVTEEQIRAAMRAVALDAKVVAEPSGAVAVAGALAHGQLGAGGPAVAVVSGGNVDPALLAEVLAG
ncbi:MAG TPA: threonine/serine dehydratase [Nocardioidaceae bacterium]|nr:threonine/serine dehydratase [Nocardioidaceae bacterium]